MLFFLQKNPLRFGEDVDDIITNLMIHHVDAIGSYIVMVAANCRTVSTVFIVASIEQSNRNCHIFFWVGTGRTVPMD